MSVVLLPPLTTMDVNCSTSSSNLKPMVKTNGMSVMPNGKNGGVSGQGVGPYDEKFGREVRNVCLDGKIGLLPEGCGGTYLMKDKAGGSVAIFKPGDEEVGLVANPKNFVGRMKKGVKPGEGWWREIAAYMMDHEQMAGVPFTQGWEMEMEGKKKVGSLQKFVMNKGNLTDWSPSLFSVSNVLKIAQLDIRMVNLDRNDENLLVTCRDGKHHLVPIDHSYTLPESFEDGVWFEWMNWKQAKEPIPKDIVEYIERLDVEKDEKILRMMNFSEESIHIMMMSTLALKIAVKSGCNLYEVALFLTKPSKHEVSPIEDVARQARKKGEDKFWVNYVGILNEKFPIKK